MPRPQVPRVSAVLPAYNSGPHLREAVESVLAQTADDLELIVVDDASTDDTPRRLASYCDPRLVCLRNPANLGQTRSLNRGLRAARGRYVARMDHDDVAEPARFARQAAYLDAHPGVTVLGTWATFIDPAGAPAGTAEPPAAPAVLAWALAGGCPLIHSSVMFRRGPVLAAGGYDPAFGLAEDYDLWTRLLQAGRRLAVLPEYLCRVRRHPGQQSRRRADEQGRLAVAVARRYVSWLLGEAAEAEPVRALMSLFCRQHPDWRRHGRDAAYGPCLALLEKVTRRCRERFGGGGRVRDEAVGLLLRSAGWTLAEAARLSGCRKLLPRAGRAALTALRLAAGW